MAKWQASEQALPEAPIYAVAEQCHGLQSVSEFGGTTEGMKPNEGVNGMEVFHVKHQKEY